MSCVSESDSCFLPSGAMTQFVLGLFFFLALGRGAEADFYDGLRAYDTGDYVAAAAEWQAEADAGDAKAQFRLGQLYEQGLGVPESFVQAHLWFNLAAAQGDPDARAAKDVISTRMTPEQIAEAQDLAAAWTPAASAQAQAPSALDEGTAEGAIETTLDLATAASIGDVARVQALLAKGSDPNSKAQDGVAILLHAIAAGHLEVVKALVGAGADIEARSANGWSALMIALYSSQPEIAQYLFDQGADVTVVDAEGITALALAERSGAAEIASLILEKIGPAPAEEPEPTPALPKDIVLQIQELLAGQGLDPGPLDGVLGPSTEQAIRAYQRQAGLSEDGQITEAFVASLVAAEPKVVAENPNPEISDARALLEGGWCGEGVVDMKSGGRLIYTSEMRFSFEDDYTLIYSSWRKYQADRIRIDDRKLSMLKKRTRANEFIAIIAKHKLGILYDISVETGKLRVKEVDDLIGVFSDEASRCNLNHL